MPKTKKLKLNEGCIKMLKIIKLLYNDEAYYDNVINIIKQGDKDQSTNNIQVTLNKYLNSLKVAGMKIIKSNNKFCLDSSFYSMNFTKEDIESIGILYNSCQNFPDKNITENILSLLKNLELRMTNKDKTVLYEITTKKDYSFYYSDMLTQIEEAQKICQSGMLIDITYLKKGKTITSKGEPKELLYNSKNVYLRLYETKLKENIDIPLQNILNYHESPEKAKNMNNVTTTVVYQLTGRLAKTYKTKENEHMENFKNGVLTIINKDEPIDKLFSRLMRYSYNCRITSPKFLKAKMQELIDKTLEIYN